MPETISLKHLSTEIKQFLLDSDGLYNPVIAMGQLANECGISYYDREEHDFYAILLLKLGLKELVEDEVVYSDPQKQTDTRMVIFKREDGKFFGTQFKIDYEDGWNNLDEITELVEAIPYQKTCFSLRGFL